MKDEQIKEITEKLENGVKKVFTGEEYKNYLTFMSKFYHYSASNTLLIWIQKPDASLVAGFKAWSEKFNRHVKKGEKGIKIIAPCPHKMIKVETDENGNQEEKKVEFISYRTVTVFDISQTEGEEIPNYIHDLTGEIEDFENLFTKIKNVSPVDILIENIEGSAKGYFLPKEKKIVIQEGLPEQQMIKTMIHEISHSLLHGDDGEESKADRNKKEVQAESVAYTVCQALGIDTSDYSFGYIAGWSEGKEIKELQESIEIIRKTAQKILDEITT